VKLEYPRKVAIGFQEGTCPLNCPKCFAFGGKLGRKKTAQKMTFENAMVLIDEISEWKIKPIIQPHIFTEPFANKELGDIIRYCHGKDIFMSIITNGILIDEKWMKCILSELDRRDTLSFSLDAVSQGTYERVRGKYSLEWIEGKVEYLLSHRTDSNGPRISVNYTVEAENCHEVQEFIEKWKNLADAVRVTVAIDENKKIPDMFRKKDGGEISGCGFLDEVMTIDTDGHVRVCQYDAFGESDFGNVFEKGILGIWQGDDLEHHRLMQEDGSLHKNDYCYQCEGACGTKLIAREMGDFLVKEADYSIYYNRRV